MSVRPIKLISGKSPFCETFFDDVRVPVEERDRRDQRRLDRRQGAARPRAQHDRRHVRRVARGRKRARAAAGSRASRASTGSATSGALADAVLRDEIAQIEMDERAFALTMQRSRDTAKAGHQPGPESSIFKIYGTELNKRRTELSVRDRGPAGPRLGRARLRRRRARR